MAFPKIVYDPGTGPTTLTLLRPPRLVPGYYKVPDRRDNVSASGVREEIYLRTDIFLEFDMEWIALGADLTAWSSFLDFALKGGQFGYYPDASLAAFINYKLENNAAKIEYRAPGQYQLRGLRFRQVVT